MTPAEAQAYWAGYTDGYRDGYDARPEDPEPPADPPDPGPWAHPAGPDYPRALIP